MTSRAQRWYTTLCYNVGTTGLNETEAEVMDRFGVSRAFVRYWTEKARDPTFHNRELGGAHRCMFTENAQLLVERVLWEQVLSDPVRSNREFARVMTGLGINVDERSGFLALIGV